MIVTGIEPDMIDAGSDQAVDEGTVVQLSGSATDPGVAINGYLWTQTSGPTVALASADAANATFTAPTVNAVTALVFKIRATDTNQTVGTDTCTITVKNTDGSVPPPPPADDGGGGGCFITLICP